MRMTGRQIAAMAHRRVAGVLELAVMEADPDEWLRMVNEVDRPAVLEAIGRIIDHHNRKGSQS